MFLYPQLKFEECYIILCTNWSGLMGYIKRNRAVIIRFFDIKL